MPTKIFCHGEKGGWIIAEKRRHQKKNNNLWNSYANKNKLFMLSLLPLMHHYHHMHPNPNSVATWACGEITSSYHPGTTSTHLSYRLLAWRRRKIMHHGRGWLKLVRRKEFHKFYIVQKSASGRVGGKFCCPGSFVRLLSWLAICIIYHLTTSVMAR